eukprot:602880-Hanusia_phi.AAC.2
MHMRQELDQTREQFREVHDALAFLRGCMHQQATVLGEKGKAFVSSTNSGTGSAGRKDIYKFAKDLPKFNGECDINRSVVSWLKDVERKLRFHQVSTDQWVGAAIIAFGNVPPEETERFSIDNDTWEEFTRFMIARWLPTEFIRKLEEYVRKNTKQSTKESLGQYIERFQSLLAHVAACYRLTVVHRELMYRLGFGRSISWMEYIQSMFVHT